MFCKYSPRRYEKTPSVGSSLIQQHRVFVEKDGLQIDTLRFLWFCFDFFLAAITCIRRSLWAIFGLPEYMANCLCCF